MLNILLQRMIPLLIVFISMLIVCGGVGVHVPSEPGQLEACGEGLFVRSSANTPA